MIASKPLRLPKEIHLLKNPRHILIAIIGVSVLVRIAAAIYLGNRVEIMPGTYDQVSYHNLAMRILAGHGFSFGEEWWPITDANAPTAHWSYLYTLYLTVIYLLVGPQPLVARLIQAFIVGILFPWLTYKIGKNVFNEKIALVGAGISAVYLYFVYYAGSLMTESFYITAILASLYLAMMLVQNTRPDQVSQERVPSQKGIYKVALALGITLGCGILLRQLILLFVPFLFLWIWWSSGVNKKKMILPLVFSSMVIGVMILPFTIYNYTRFERFVLLNTNSGYAFFWGNHPIYGTHFEPILPAKMGTYQELIPTELHTLDEAALDQALLKRGIQFILDEPDRYILLSLSRIPAYFMFWASGESGTISNLSRVFSFGIAWPFMLAGVILAPMSRFSRQKFSLSSPVMLLYSFITIYTLIHVLTWTLIRYRLPVDAVLIPFAALALFSFSQFMHNRLLKKGQASP